MVSPVHAMIQSVLDGKDIPTLSPLVDIMFLNELKHAVLLGVQDSDRIKGNVVLDEGVEGEEFIKRGGDTVFIRQGDIVLRDDEGIIASFLEGSDERTKVHRDTKNCVYFGCFIEGQKRLEVIYKKRSRNPTKRS